MASRLFDPSRLLFDARKLTRRCREKRAFGAERSCEQLEGRVVLSMFGGGIGGGMPVLARSLEMGGSTGYGGGAEVGRYAVPGGMGGPVTFSSGMAGPVALAGGTGSPVAVSVGVGGLVGGMGDAGVRSLMGGLADLGLTGVGVPGAQGIMLSTSSSSSTSADHPAPDRSQDAPDRLADRRHLLGSYDC